MKKSVEVGGAVVLLVVLAGIVNNMGADEVPTATPVLTTSTASSQSTTTSVPSTSTPTQTPSSSPATIPTMTASVATTSEAPAPTPTVRTYRVTKVVDGDTIVVSGGARVRLIGIDAPEANQCGAATATRLLSSYILGKSVTLTVGAQTDKDRYGRLLRYVNVGSFDPGLKLIQVGRAVARYDSRDGYGAHPREALYARADAASPNANACSSPAPVPAPVPLNSVYYANCAAARAAGAAPLYVGEPGYRQGSTGIAMAWPARTEAIAMSMARAPDCVSSVHWEAVAWPVHAFGGSGALHVCLDAGGGAQGAEHQYSGHSHTLPSLSASRYQLYSGSLPS